jgi:hypothetical protein
VRVVQPLLKAGGFTKQRNTFNRTTAPGVVQVVNFEMPRRSPPTRPPGSAHVARLNSDIDAVMYARFRVGLGVWLSRVESALIAPGATSTPTVIPGPRCHLRATLADLMGLQGDWWWSLRPEPDLQGQVISDGLSEIGLPWLDRWRTPTQIVDAYEASDDIPIEVLKAPLLIAILFADEGRQHDAAVVLRDYLQTVTFPPHADFVESLALRLGITGTGPGHAGDRS